MQFIVAQTNEFGKRIKQNLIREGFVKLRHCHVLPDANECMNIILSNITELCLSCSKLLFFFKSKFKHWGKLVNKTTVRLVKISPETRVTLPSARHTVGGCGLVEK